MGIPRKGSRRLEVNGEQFRYIVKETHVPDERDQKELSVTIQADVERPGRVLQFRYPYGAEISPEFLRTVVRDARSKEWDPAEKGAAMIIEVL